MAEHRRKVEYNEQLGAKPFVLHVGKIDQALSIEQFEQFFEDCEEAMGDYWSSYTAWQRAQAKEEKFLDEEYRKVQAEVSRKRR